MNIFFAGGEQTTLSNALLENGVQHMLYSYFYLWAHHREHGAAAFQANYPKVSWFLDSGAFTYSSAIKQSDSVPPAEEFVKLYFSFIQKHGHRYDRIAELDLDLAGTDVRQVKAWRNEMLSSWPDLPITPVWHVHRGIEEWERYCADPRIRHLAFGSDVDDLGLMARMANMARERGKTIHGLAQTKALVEERVRLTSVDSTSWSVGNRYGIMYVWAGSKFIKLRAEDRHLRRNYLRYFRRHGIDYKKLQQEDSHELRKANIIAWRLLSEKWQERAKRREMAGFGIGEPKYPEPPEEREE